MCVVVILSKMYYLKKVFVAFCKLIFVFRFQYLYITSVVPGMWVYLGGEGRGGACSEQ